MIFFSACLYLLPKNRVENKGLEIKNERLANLFNFIYKNPNQLIYGSLIVFIIVAAGCFNLETNNFFTEEFDKDDLHFKDFVYFENQFGGVRPFQMVITCKDSTADVLDYEVDVVNAELNVLDSKCNEILQKFYLKHQIGTLDISDVIKEFKVKFPKENMNKLPSILSVQ